jgi:hypothetical protein
MGCAACTEPFTLHYLMQSFKNSFPNSNIKSLSTKEVENVIKSLKPKNSSGYDAILTYLLTYLLHGAESFSRS